MTSSSKSDSVHGRDTIQRGGADSCTYIVHTMKISFTNCITFRIARFTVV